MKYPELLDTYLAYRSKMPAKITRKVRNRYRQFVIDLIKEIEPDVLYSDVMSFITTHLMAEDARYLAHKHETTLRVISHDFGFRLGCSLLDTESEDGMFVQPAALRQGTPVWQQATRYDKPNGEYIYPHRTTTRGNSTVTEVLRPLSSQS